MSCAVAGHRFFDDSFQYENEEGGHTHLGQVGQQVVDVGVVAQAVAAPHAEPAMRWARRRHRPRRQRGRPSIGARPADVGADKAIVAGPQRCRTSSQIEFQRNAIKLGEECAIGCLRSTSILLFCFVFFHVESNSDPIGVDCFRARILLRNAIFFINDDAITLINIKQCVTQ